MARRGFLEPRAGAGSPACPAWNPGRCGRRGCASGEHFVYGVLLDEAAAVVDAEDAALEDGREGTGVVGGEVGGLVEADAVAGLGEDTVEDHDLPSAIRRTSDL